MIVFPDKKSGSFRYLLSNNGKCHLETAARTWYLSSRDTILKTHRCLAIDETAVRRQFPRSPVDTEMPKGNAVMRRADKEIIDRDEMEAVINASDICRVAICDGSYPYIVPMHFGYENGTLYFHSAKKGRKIDLLQRNPVVCIEFDTDVHIVPGECPCQWTASYRSVIATGVVSFIMPAEEKANALSIISRKYTGSDHDFTTMLLDNVVVFAVTVETMTGKKNRC